MIRIIENGEKIKQIPEVPFLIKDPINNEYFIVAYDEENRKYRYLRLLDGHITRVNYNSIEEMFEAKDSKNDIILDCELIIKGQL